MKFLDGIREPNKNLKLKNKILNTSLILLLGIILGVVSKWLDSLSIDDSIWWQHLLGILNLSNFFSEFGIWIFLALIISTKSQTPWRAGLNVFLFFLGMTASYHLYTVLFCGFNPRNYMMIWYGITLLTPVLAFICWYGVGKGKLAFTICSMIIAVMVICSFSIGFWYFDFRSAFDTAIFLGTLIVLHTDFRSNIIGLVVSFVLAYIMRIFF